MGAATAAEGAAMPETSAPNPARAVGERCHDPYLRCALYGAAQVALGIRGCCVLSHSPQGCYQLVDAAFGWQNADYEETLTLCTKLCEDEIVHGGEETLARTIREARDESASVMFVLTACGPEIVGDDVVAVCAELSGEVGFEVVPILSAGFRGDQNHGADIALEAILKHLVHPGAEPDGEGSEGEGSEGNGDGKDARSVCLIAPHANQNPTWMGDLAWVERVLERLGARVAAVLAHETRLEDLQAIPKAAASVVLSHDAGQAAAESLAERFGVEQWCRGIPLPIGFTNIRRWLVELGRRLGAEDAARELVAEGEAMVVDRLRRKGLEQSAMHRAPAAIVADATVGVPLVRFIAEDLEMIPELVCLRSGSADARDLLAAELSDLGLAPRVVHQSDVYQAKMALAEVRPEMVFGSNVERHAAENLDIPFVFRVVNPISRFRLADREYFGYEGMLNLIETIQNDWLDRYRSQTRRYRARW